MHTQQKDRDFLINLTANLVDAVFFGMAIGFASFVTIIPLFVSQLTDSAILIGLVPAIHSLGWQLPQLFMASPVARLSRYKPMVLRLTVHERWPFLGLALIAWFLPQIDNRLALGLVFLMLAIQGLGGGITANAWQSMVGKIFPSRWHGRFFGLQAGLANAIMALGALGAGFLLEALPFPQNFAAIFAIALFGLVLSYFALFPVREAEVPPAPELVERQAYRRNLLQIMRSDRGFRRFLLVRNLSQFAIMAVSFYSVYAVRQFEAPGAAIGLMTALMSGSSIFANALMGWAGDRWGHQVALGIGTIAMFLSAVIAWLAPAYSWFYLAFILAGVASVAVWTTPIAMTLEFGGLSQRPAYLGLSHTLTAPSTLLAPILGGWLADWLGYPAAFVAGAVASLVVLFFLPGLRIRQASSVS
ncbi:MAG: MFS transporter [Anaerolineales bacterium]|nr:MFS transporter [Anaerolineales bacterium]